MGGLRSSAVGRVERDSSDDCEIVMRPKIVKTTEMAAGRFLRLDLIEYNDSKCVARKWEAAQRQKAQAAVYILAVLKPSNRLIVLRQYRVPIDAYCIECPAGLIDDGEEPSVAAARELMEETGYVGKVEWQSGPTCSSAGMTGEMVTIFRMTVDETLPENKTPKQHLDDGEEIDVNLIPLNKLEEYLKERVQAGDKLDSRIAAWSAAFSINN